MARHSWARAGPGRLLRPFRPSLYCRTRRKIINRFLISMASPDQPRDTTSLMSQATRRRGRRGGGRSPAARRLRVTGSPRHNHCTGSLRVALAGGDSDVVRSEPESESWPSSSVSRVTLESVFAGRLLQIRTRRPLGPSWQATTRAPLSQADSEAGLPPSGSEESSRYTGRLRAEPQAVAGPGPPARQLPS